MKTIKIKTILIFASIPLLLVSCFTARDYTRPQEEVVTANYYRTDELAQDSLTLAAVSWKELFTDPQLQTYIEEGLQNNIDIRVAIQQIQISESLLKQGKAGYLPSLIGTAQYTRLELSENSQFGGQFSTLDVYELSGGLSWEADIWGKIRSNKRAAEASYLQSIAAHKAVKSRLVANIASIYYQLLSFDQQVRITEETIATRSRALETTQALKKAGIVTAQAILVTLKNQSRLLENSLSVLLGSDARAMNRGALDAQEISTALKTGVPSQLLANRPDVIAAEYNLINSFELTNVARSQFYPSLTLTANSGFQSLDFEKLFSASSIFATIVGGLTQPIFNRRQIRTQYEVAQAQQEQSKLNFRQAMLVAGKEVSDALYTYDASTQRKEIKQKEFEAYALATQYSEELLDNGLVNYIEVLRSRENQLNSSLDVVSARNNQLQSIVDLYEALGGGWQ
jgi:NodT family efflux transporter outer membrane factor (OMF) lipoprotein